MKKIVIVITLGAAALGLGLTGCTPVTPPVAPPPATQAPSSQAPAPSPVVPVPQAPPAPAPAPQPAPAPAPAPAVSVEEQNAIDAAQSYLQTSSFSCKGLIEQLSSSAGEGFTTAQATYGAHQTGVCG